MYLTVYSSFNFSIWSFCDFEGIHLETDRLAWVVLTVFFKTFISYHCMDGDFTKNFDLVKCPCLKNWIKLVLKSIFAFANLCLVGGACPPGFFVTRSDRTKGGQRQEVGSVGTSAEWHGPWNPRSGRLGRLYSALTSATVQSWGGRWFTQPAAAAGGLPDSTLAVCQQLL